MRSLINGLLDRLSTKISQRSNTVQPVRRRPGDSYHICDTRWMRASLESAEYVDHHMPGVMCFENDIALLSYILTSDRIGGHILELGVASGRTINYIAQRVEHEVHGFDSFQGLPEDWTPQFKKGAFAQEPPAVAGNVKLHVGLFDKTIAKFAEDYLGAISVIHIDCDLYSSTKVALDILTSRIMPGTKIIFDEYFNYPGWQHHERKAFSEFCRKNGVSYKYLGYVPSHQQVAVEILSRDEAAR